MLRCLLPVFLLASPLASASYVDGLTAVNLLGSHFGIPFFNATFDYVVVGGGTAGLTLATRLAQNASNSVAVIEAGGFSEMDNGNLTAIPAFCIYWGGSAPNERNPMIDWEFYTSPMPGFGERSILYTQGKTLGGGSSRNSLTYHRPTVQSMQMWADQVGDSSYEFGNMLPYYEKSVKFEAPSPGSRPANSSVQYNASSNSAAGGPLKVSYPGTPTIFGSWVKKAFHELGLRQMDGFLSGGLLGFDWSVQTLDGDSQTRSSSETAFLRSALMNTTNLSVYKSTLAERILFDEAKRATGVAVNTGGVRYVLSASKEVVVSAGAFRSPQLLMVSGVGPAEQLRPLGIPVVSELGGVGQNMWDQVDFGVTREVSITTHNSLLVPETLAASVAQYAETRTGLLTNTGTDILGWEKLPARLRANLTDATRAGLRAFPADWPELELIASDGYAGDLRDVAFGSPMDGKNYASILVGLMTPFSRGNVTINSTSTAVNPVVQPNLLGDPRDRDLAVQAFRRAREIFDTNALRPLLVGSETFPGANLTSDHQILQSIMASSNTIYHASATNAMGKPGDPHAVVDSQCRVFGVSGLRVVDVSAFPFLPPGHPQSSVYALAEKIAEVMQR